MLLVHYFGQLPAIIRVYRPCYVAIVLHVDHSSVRLAACETFPRRFDCQHISIFTYLGISCDLGDVPPRPWNVIHVYSSGGGGL